MIQILQATKDTTNVTKEVVSAIASGHTELIIEKFDRYVYFRRKKHFDCHYRLHRRTFSYLTYPTRDEQYAITPESGNQYPTFLKSLVSILLNVLLIVSVVGALGINTTSFAALLASAGVAIGMALSGNLQNFAGGLIILFFKPYKVGDWIEAQSVSGSVTAIQIMHTLVTTADNKVVYIPNGAMSSGVITNYSRLDTRRVEWIVGVDYGEDIDKVKSVVNELIQKDNRILKEPAPVIALHALDSSSVNVTIRVWVANGDYWNVYFEMNKNIYDEFNKQGIDFPFPQMTIHQA